jgi:hypothetical protein
MRAGNFESCVRFQEVKLRDPFVADAAPVVVSLKDSVSAKESIEVEKPDWQKIGQSVLAELVFPRVYERRNLLCADVELLVTGRLPPGVKVYSWKLFNIYVNGLERGESSRFDTATVDVRQVGRTRLDGEVRLVLNPEISTARSISISAQLLLELSVPELVKVTLSVPERYCGVFEYGA